jgi:hypothetical protein
MRMYENIWISLKRLDPKDAATRGVSITAPKYFHKRILKAVKKEKNNDMAFKLFLGDKVATLAHTRNGSILSFKLYYSLTAADF